MKNLSLLIKPASGQCNMKCKYCFYYDVMEHRDIGNRGFMTEAITTKIIDRIFENDIDTVSIAFQGGEPTLIGVQYFIDFVDYVKKLKPSKTMVYYSIQTNGTKITKEFANFFKENSFLVGISIDGTEDVHNKYRLNNNNEKTYKSALNGVSLLKEYGVDYNILTVVTDETIKDFPSVYLHLKKLGSNYLQFIPCIDSFEPESGLSLSNDSYSNFLIKLFDLWYLDFMNGIRISIRYFDDLLKIILGFAPGSCTLKGKCYSYHVIEANGDVYPCDFYVIDNWKIGNVMTETLADMLISKKSIEFVQSSISNNPTCNNCDYYSLCRGGCRRNKEPFHNISDAKTKYCEAIKTFLDYSLERLEKVAEVILNEQN